MQDAWDEDPPDICLFETEEDRKQFPRFLISKTQSSLSGWWSNEERKGSLQRTYTLLFH